MAINGKVNRIGLGVLLLSFSIEARAVLEEAIRNTGLVAISIDGRSPEATEGLRAFQGDVVVVDSSSEDVSLTQTVREVGRVRPTCLVLAVRDDRQMVAVYREGHSVGTVESLEAALLNQKAGTTA